MQNGRTDTRRFLEHRLYTRDGADVVLLTAMRMYSQLELVKSSQKQARCHSPAQIGRNKCSHFNLWKRYYPPSTPARRRPGVDVLTGPLMWLATVSAQLALFVGEPADRSVR